MLPVVLSTALCWSVESYATDLFIPAYFSSNSAYWSSAANAAQQGKGAITVTATFNPGNGPGTAIDQNYVTDISNMHANGGKVLGYIHTSYASRPLVDVYADITKYASWYEIDGFFIDEMTADQKAEHVNYYQSLYTYIKQINNGKYTAVGNPGTIPAEVYARTPLADKIVVFEGTAKSYAGFSPAPWQSNYGPATFINLIYNAKSNQMQTAFSASGRNGKNVVGTLYVTSDNLPNPWDTLPNYWNQEVQTGIATP
jgi:hypothetical protein